MGTISVSLPSDGTTADAADVNTPITTIVNEFNGNIDNDNIKTAAAIATSKLASDNGISAGMISASAITLGYSQRTTDFVPGTTAETLITGLTTSVTTPGTRRIRITVYSASVGSASGVNVLKLYDGTFGTGSPTQIQQFNSNNTNNGVCMVYVTNSAPAAGSKTYSVTITNSSANPSMSASATLPAFLLVEAI